jgi:hypothetical protein
MNFTHTIRQWVLCMALAGAGAFAAQAALVDGSGNITSWNFTPFNNANVYGDWGNGAPPNPSGAGAIQSGATNVRSWTEGNNAAPIDYPSGTFEPSPGGTDGEGFDQEFLGWRLLNNGAQVEVIVVSSIDPTNGVTHTGADGVTRTWHMGDVFINVDGNAGTGVSGGYEFALTSGQWTTTNNDPLHPADNDINPIDHTMDIGLYNINNVNDVHYASNTGGAGGMGLPAGDLAMINPVNVRANAGLGDAIAANLSFETDSYDYGTLFGANEDGTWIYRWVIDTSALGANWNPYAAIFHLSEECGNDFLDAGPLNPDENDEPPVPEPATLGLIGLGLASLGVLKRRKLKA